MKTYVWTFPTRFFHWYLVATLVLAYFLTDYVGIHMAIGLSIGCAIIFRVLWGFWGPRYSRFSDFPISKGKIQVFINDVRNQERLFTGHNPAASVVMAAIIITTLLICVAGVFTALSMDTPLFGNAKFNGHEAFVTIHEVLVYTLMGLVFFHLAGIYSSWKYNKETNVIESMVYGYKNMPGVNARLSNRQKILALLFLIIAITVLVLALVL